MSQITDLSLQEMRGTIGGDWFEKTWGIMLGVGIAAGFFGCLPMLGIAGIAGLILAVVPVN